MKTKLFKHQFEMGYLPKQTEVRRPNTRILYTDFRGYLVWPVPLLIPDQPAFTPFRDNALGQHTERTVQMDQTCLSNIVWWCSGQCLTGVGCGSRFKRIQRHQSTCCSEVAWDWLRRVFDRASENVGWCWMFEIKSLSNTIRQPGHFIVAVFKLVVANSIGQCLTNIFSDPFERALNRACFPIQVTLTILVTAKTLENWDNINYKLKIVLLFIQLT